ncbi:hypothetical protein [Flavobacterium sp. C3NV]|uniref:hypothetical protein n=1 Tax=Flavobacterium sp. C3NV TaxID=3393358 RepID=UPI0039900817
MITTQYDNYHQQTSLFSGSQIFMEKHERNHLDHTYESVNEPLLCFSKDSTYPDGEFCSTLEEKAHGDFLL